MMMLRSRALALTLWWWSTSLLGVLGMPEGIPDDVYHCRDPSDVDATDSISCDPDTYEWNVGELRERQPPRLCGGEAFVPANRDELANVQDWFEPCVLWAMAFGDLRPTADPTPAPTVPEPTLKPEATEEESAGDALSTDTATGAPTRRETEPPTTPDRPPAPMILDPMTLTLSWPYVLGDTFSLDRVELQDLTETHILEFLRARMPGPQDAVVGVNLGFAPGVPRVNQWTEKVNGILLIDDETNTLPESVLQTLVLQSFESNGLELYEFRLKIADDPRIQEVASVAVQTTRSASFNNNNNNNILPAGEGASPNTILVNGTPISTITIAVVAAGTAAVLAICLFSYCMVCRSPKTRRGPKSLEGMTIEHPGPSSRSRSRAHQIQLEDLPSIPTRSSSGEEDPVGLKLDLEHQGPASAGGSDGGSRWPSGAMSVGTSVYSYFNGSDNDHHSAVMGSDNHSYVYSVAGGASTVASSEEPRHRGSAGTGVLRSVLDTLQTHFGHDAGEDAEENDEEAQGGPAAQPDVISPMSAHSSANMLGPDTTESDNDSTDSNSLLYEHSQADSLSMHSSSVVGSQASLPGDPPAAELSTPTRERLETMWKRQDREETTLGATPDEAAAAEPEELQETAKAGNLASDRAPEELRDTPEPSVLSPPNDPLSLVNTSIDAGEECYEPEDPLAGVVLVPEERVRSVPPVPTAVPEPETAPAKIVDGVPEEDSGMSLRLPSQLQAPAADQTDASSCGSGSSGGSSSHHGIRRTNSDRSISSAASTDSAKYRSLLNQGDTNDASFFGLEEPSAAAHEPAEPEAAVPAPEEAPADGNDDDEEEETQDTEAPPPAEASAPSQLIAQLDTMIQDFDKVWAEEDNKNEVPNGKPAEPSNAIGSGSLLQTYSSRAIASPVNLASDSDDDDLYVEDDDEEDVVADLEQKASMDARESIPDATDSAEDPTPEVDASAEERPEEEEENNDDDGNSFEDSAEDPTPEVDASAEERPEEEEKNNDDDGNSFEGVHSDLTFEFESPVEDTETDDENMELTDTMASF